MFFSCLSLGPNFRTFFELFGAGKGLTWTLVRRYRREDLLACSMMVMSPPKRRPGQHGVRRRADEIALTWLLLEEPWRGEAATLPSTIPTLTYGRALH